VSRPRKFDWDAAKRMRKSGMTYPAIAEHFGVSVTAIARVCDSRYRSRMDAAAAAYQRRGVCVDCGTRISSNVSRPVYRCKPCSALHRATNVRDTELRCVTCKEWKPDNDYPYSRSARPTHRGRHKTCRTCLTGLRRDYRDKHKVPCANGCGTLVLAPNEQRVGGTGMCHRCANATKKHRAQRPGGSTAAVG
jgi:hypothetical protein